MLKSTADWKVLTPTKQVGSQLAGGGGEGWERGRQVWGGDMQQGARRPGLAAPAACEQPCQQ